MQPRKNGCTKQKRAVLWLQEIWAARFTVHYQNRRLANYQTLKMEKTEYSKLTIEASEGGWIVAEAKQPKKVFVRWESVVSYIESRLTTK